MIGKRSGLLRKNSDRMAPVVGIQEVFMKRSGLGPVDTSAKTTVVRRLVDFTRLKRSFRL